MKSTTIHIYNEARQDMIRIACKDPLYTYDIYHIVKAFLPAVEIRQSVNERQESLVEIQLESDSCFFVSCAEAEKINNNSDRKRMIGRKLYTWLMAETKRVLPWGMLTGIRPTKLIMSQMEAGRSEEEIKKQFAENYFVSEEKLKLGMRIAKEEMRLLEQLDYGDGYSLYVGIPFCPTTCSYCSFTSFPIAAWKHRVSDYLDALEKEIEHVSNAMKHKKLNTIYIGGGTPTTLEPEEMRRLLIKLKKHFSDADLKEFTVEAGRPDSITREKLEVLQEFGVSRISINPQTMQQKTLDLIGRKHTGEAIVKAYHLARELGFDNINMDLIAGLPGETTSDMEDTLKQIQVLDPDSLTIHSLAIKRAARMGHEKQAGGTTGEELAEMIEMGAIYAEAMGMRPYYMYRQKNIAGSFENVGYAKVDKAGIYNILIMEEKQSIIALGAGATTKLVYDDHEDGKRKIVRVENVKDAEQYITRVDEMIKRKEEEIWR